MPQCYPWRLVPSSIISPNLSSTFAQTCRAPASEKRGRNRDRGYLAASALEPSSQVEVHKFIKQFQHHKRSRFYLERRTIFGAALLLYNRNDACFSRPRVDAPRRLAR